jgi:uncharacterized tellurite resistance protein B-like protein
MNPATTSGSGTGSSSDSAVVIRQAVQALHELDARTSEHLGALAFILMRVARADGRLSRVERARMEEILVRNAGIPAEHAVLVTEIASHRAALADCGCSYGISRRLRFDLDADRRRSIIGLLTAVAAADGDSCALERREIDQIAREIGLDI